MMLLEKRTAIVYGAGGAIGSAVARAYAARANAGGLAVVAPVDALNRAAVEQHASAVADAAGGIDIAFNATSNEDVQGIPLLDMTYEDFVRPVTKAFTGHMR